MYVNFTMPEGGRNDTLQCCHVCVRVCLQLISGHRLPRLMAEISSVFVHIKVVGHVHDEKDYRSRVVGLLPTA